MRMKDEEIVNRSDRLVDIANVAAKIHSWESQPASNAVNLNVLSGGRAVVQIKQD